MAEEKYNGGWRRLFCGASPRLPASDFLSPISWLLGSLAPGVLYVFSARIRCEGPRKFSLIQTVLSGWRCPRHFVPGYDRTVPPGHFATGFN